MIVTTLPGWDRLRHGGLLLDPQRMAAIASYEPAELQGYLIRDLRQRVSRMQDDARTGSGVDSSDFVSFVLRSICGFDDGKGTWQRGPSVPTEWGRTALSGETVKPRQLWKGPHGGLLPVFIDREKRLGVGRGRRITSQVLGWLRAGNEQLALITNGRQWRLAFAGLDFDAWCEWDIDLWLEEGNLSDQVTALRTLLQPALWTPTDEGGQAPLLTAIRDSRKGQAELSAILGEHVRSAVEVLVQAHGEILLERCADVQPAEIYRAAVRVVMRLVVVLFAESRELLPRSNAIYHHSYGLGGLFDELEKSAARGRNRLARSFSAWPRIIALFKLICEGSHHPDLPVPAYGGDLFAPGDAGSPDGLSQALALFENAWFERELLSDREVHKMLEEITRTSIKIRQGRSSTRITSPIDFSDLSSEYIGILYEGLLDFELKTAPAGDPVIFLAIGDQPALPLSRLEAMDDKSLKNLFEKLKESGDDDEERGDQAAEEEPDEAHEDEENGEEEDEEEEGTPDETDDNDTRHTTRSRAETWARRAVGVAGLVGGLRGTATPERRLAHEQKIAHKARQLVSRVILPGEWYLVRWGGTRKGSGTFYTRPGLAIPTVHRTLRPLCYGEKGVLAPEEILALKVCDPACGSGTFPVAALRYLTDVLYESLHQHGRIFNQQGRALVSLLEGDGNHGEESECLASEMLPCAPDDDTFEPRLKAILRRHVVERCIHGVDLDLLAVELCRLSLWVETMDRTLPFSFLDHKIKCGNALVGAWFDQYRHYPAMAFKNREGGDKNHSNGVHFEKEARGKAIKEFVKTITSLLADDIKGQGRFGETAPLDARAVHDEALSLLERLHTLPVHESTERARLYRELLASPSWNGIKEAMDLWCACWFWPADELDEAPLPTTFANPPEKTRKLCAELAARKRFFHWELEFPDVFRAGNEGFDAVLGNPPWETLQPNSKEYFSNIDPLYRSYGKQEALRYQTAYFEKKLIEFEWLDYCSDFADYSNWMKFVANPFGDPDKSEKPNERIILARGKANTELHAYWRSRRAKDNGFADSCHPFQYRGEGKAYTYKLFLEQAHALLRQNGHFGFVVPSGIYSDHGTSALRTLFMEQCSWEWLFSFENRKKIFDIDSRFKFNIVIVRKGGSTQAIRTAFMRRDLDDWERAEELTIDYTAEQVTKFSPHSKAILEIQSTRDLEILEKIYSNSVLLGDDGPNGWGIRYAQGDFNMTSDSMLFPPRPQWEAKGYRPDEYSRWLLGNWRPIGELWAELGVSPLPDGEVRCAQPPYDRLPIPRADVPAGVILSREADAFISENDVEDVALPLYEGRMVNTFDFSEKGWESGKGRRAVWRSIEWDSKVIEPQYIMSQEDFSIATDSRTQKIGFLAIGSATNMRSMYSSILPNFPCGNSIGTLSSSQKLNEFLLFAEHLASLVFDYIIRLRLTGLNLNYFVIEEAPVTPIIRKSKGHFQLIKSHSEGLFFPSSLFADKWLQLRNTKPRRLSWKHNWALTPAERTRLKASADATSFGRMGLSSCDLSLLLEGCDYINPSSEKLNPKGFWRVDKDRDPELRHTVLTLVAFHDLEEKIAACNGDREAGIEAFLNQNNGEGWLLPETLRLADYDLGHDDRALEHQPVASRLGPRFFDWQLAQSPEESWRECHLHARNLLGEAGYKTLLDDITAEKSGQIDHSDRPDAVSQEPPILKKPDKQFDLFD